MSKFTESIRNSANKVVLSLKKSSPEILLAAGIIGAVTATVLACKATTKVDEILAETRENIDNVHAVSENPDLKERYSEKDAKKDLAIIYAKTGVKLLKLYGPALAVGSASIAAILGSHGVLKKRYISISSAYAALDSSFKKYRERVTECLGEDAEKYLRLGMTKKEIEEKITDDNGKEKTVKKNIDIVDCPYDISPYAKFFDEYSSEWVKDAEQNLMFLRQQEQYANNLLHAKGFLVLNEVYRALGLPETNAGMTVGWLYRPNDSAYKNHVDFGIYNVHRKASREFVNGYERSILLDFNPDGDIYGSL